MNDLISRGALLTDLQEYLNQEVSEAITFTLMGVGINLAMERVKMAPPRTLNPCGMGGGS